MDYFFFFNLFNVALSYSFIKQFMGAMGFVLFFVSFMLFNIFNIFTSVFPKEKHFNLFIYVVVIEICLSIQPLFLFLRFFKVLFATK